MSDSTKHAATARIRTHDKPFITFHNDLTALIGEAVAIRATDIHMDPTSDGHSIRFRVDGLVIDRGKVSEAEGVRLLHLAKIAADLNIEKAYSPLESQLSWEAEDDRRDVRVTIIPTMGGESVHLRILVPPDRMHDITQLGLSDRDLQKVYDTLERPEGLIAVAGPTGAGKTTTVYSLVTCLELPNMIAASIEDPIEFDLPLVRQVEVNENYGITMYSGLRILLRMDPDVILVGEVRDRESAITAGQAANAGRFVLASIHARDAAAAIDSLHYLGIPTYLLAGAVRLVIAQDLIRKLCTKCAKQRPTIREERSLFEAENVDCPDNVWEPVGCQACQQRGYTGRIGIFEVVPISDSLSRSITDGAHQTKLRDLIRQAGIRSMLADALEKAGQGVTSMREVFQLYAPGGEAIERD